MRVCREKGTVRITHPRSLKAWNILSRNWKNISIIIITNESRQILHAVSSKNQSNFLGSLHFLFSFNLNLFIIIEKQNTSAYPVSSDGFCGNIRVRTLDKREEWNASYDERDHAARKEANQEGKCSTTNAVFLIKVIWS
jgi:hypothetical protein